MLRLSDDGVRVWSAMTLSRCFATSRYIANTVSTRPAVYIHLKWLAPHHVIMRDDRRDWINTIDGSSHRRSVEARFLKVKDRRRFVSGAIGSEYHSHYKNNNNRIVYRGNFHPFLKLGLELETFCTVKSPKQFLPTLTISMQIWTNNETHTFKKWGGRTPRPPAGSASVCLPLFAASCVNEL